MRKRIVKLCPAAEKIIKDIPPYIGLTGDALRATVERCVKVQRRHDKEAAWAPMKQSYGDHRED